MYAAWAFLCIIGIEFRIVILRIYKMKKLVFLFVLMFSVSMLSMAQDTKQLSDCIVTYDVIVEDSKADPQIVKAMSGALKTLYIKGSKSRSDLETNGFKQIVLFDTKTDSTIILREIGNSKYISYLNGSQRKEKNKKYENVQFSNTNEKKTILGYECKKVIAKLADGSTYSVYYAPSIIASNNDFEYQFKSLNGFVLEYEAESENGKTRVKYVASKITLTPVPNVKFEVPKSGYRIL